MMFVLKLDVQLQNVPVLENAVFSKGTGGLDHRFGHFPPCRLGLKPQAIYCRVDRRMIKAGSEIPLSGSGAGITVLTKI